MWRGEAVTFELIGTLYRNTLKFDLYKTHLGQYTNTTLYQGAVQVLPSLKLLGGYSHGKLVLYRVGALDLGDLCVCVCVCVCVCGVFCVCMHVYVYMCVCMYVCVCMLCVLMRTCVVCVCVLYVQ